MTGRTTAFEGYRRSIRAVPVLNLGEGADIGIRLDQNGKTAKILLSEAQMDPSGLE